MKKQRVSYNGMKISFGIDVHRTFFVISAVKDGEFLKRSRILPTGESVVNYIRKYFPGCRARSCYEAGFSGFWLHRHLTAHDIENIVVNPGSVAIEVNNRVKTDKRDSLHLARQLNVGALRGITVPSEDREKRRTVVRTREQLVAGRTRVRNQIRMKLHQFGLLSVTHQGVMTLSLAEELISKIECKALQVSFEVLVSQWKSFNEGIKRLKRALSEQAKKDELEVLYRSVPGVGIIVGRTLSAELGDMKQFKNERALFSYTGLTPCEYSSGEKVRRGRISRQGSPRLRHILVEAAWRAVRRDSYLASHFEQLSARSGKKRAIVAIARKLVGRIRAVLRTALKYEPHQRVVTQS